MNKANKTPLHSVSMALGLARQADLESHGVETGNPVADEALAAGRRYLRLVEEKFEAVQSLIAWEESK